MTFPRATARLQLHAGFTLLDAARQAAYYARLGVSHLYLSPITQAVPGSAHGYDVADHAAVSAELGGEAALRELAAAARAQGLGLIVDIVPNHMASDVTANAWWRDVLEHGPASAHARYFDIDWQPADPALHGKVLLPVLGAQYGACLRDGSIALGHEPGQGYCIHVHGTPYPIAAGTLAAADTVAATLALYAPGAPGQRERLHGLLQAQHYRLAWWRTAPDQINWRRFFEVTGLVGVRVEQPEVFDAVHALVLRLYAEGLIDGVRVDHIDGLADPGGYARRLRQALVQAGRAQGRPHEPYIVVEKILAEDESLPANWGVEGTTGYDFMDQVGALLHDPGAAEILRDYWRRISGDGRSPAEQLLAARQRMVERHFPAERAALVRCLLRIVRLQDTTRDWSAVQIDRALSAVLAHFPVYRSYAGDTGRQAGDRAPCAHAWTQARRALAPREQDPMAELLALLDALLGGSAFADTGPAEYALRAEALRRFQQLTPPLAAKALEDTLFYRLGPLISRNEVGSPPDRPGLPPQAFVALAQARARALPHAMLATATHDHKRGEDVRARLAVITEDPQAWLRAADQWLAATEGPVAATDRYMLLQTLVGAWPLALRQDDPAAVQAYLARVAAWQQKAMREAKLHTDWHTPDPAYEQAGQALVHAVAGQPALWSLVAGQAQALALPGLVNGLAQALLRCTLPGVPDLYQGREFWDFSLVDPDNRTEVDYRARARMLAAIQAGEPAAVQAAWASGRVKQAVIHACLALRARRPALFARGDLQVLPVRGAQAPRLLALLRSHAGEHLLILVPHLCARELAFYARDEAPGQAAARFWGDTAVQWPQAPDGCLVHDALQCAHVRGPADAGPAAGTGHAGGALRAGQALPVAALLARLPVALCHVARG
ncbi:malto-oligosyltrehalose synthase [Orrella sp. JC864]|uniref:malto-oligosyltrehalose synthase n=1 Tax=Orrella sp. JC864 TaxID=3120298 RepID=UPI00300871A2